MSESTEKKAREAFKAGQDAALVEGGIFDFVRLHEVASSLSPEDAYVLGRVVGRSVFNGGRSEQARITWMRIIWFEAREGY